MIRQSPSSATSAASRSGRSNSGGTAKARNVTGIRVNGADVWAGSEIPTCDAFWTRRPLRWLAVHRATCRETARGPRALTVALRATPRRFPRGMQICADDWRTSAPYLSNGREDLVLRATLSVSVPRREAIKMPSLQRSRAVIDLAFQKVFYLFDRAEVERCCLKRAQTITILYLALTFVLDDARYACGRVRSWSFVSGVASRPMNVSNAAPNR